MVVERVDFRLRSFEMGVRGACVVQVLVEFHEIHVELNTIQGSLGWALGQMSQGSVVFPNSIRSVFLKSCDFATDGVQAIMFRIERCGTPEKGLRIFERTDSHFTLCC